MVVVEIQRFQFREVFDALQVLYVVRLQVQFIDALDFIHRQFAVATEIVVAKHVAEIAVGEVGLVDGY